MYINADHFKTDKKLWLASDQQIKQFIRQRLNRLSYDDLNQDYDYKEKEDVRLVKDYNASDPIFEAEIEIPEHLREKPEKKPGGGRISR